MGVLRLHGSWWNYNWIAAECLLFRRFDHFQILWTAIPVYSPASCFPVSKIKFIPRYWLADPLCLHSRIGIFFILAPSRILLLQRMCRCSTADPIIVSSKVSYRSEIREWFDVSPEGTGSCKWTCSNHNEDFHANLDALSISLVLRSELWIRWKPLERPQFPR